MKIYIVVDNNYYVPNHLIQIVNLLHDLGFVEQPVAAPYVSTSR